MRAIILFLVLTLFAGPLLAAQQRYALEPDISQVNFEWDFGEDIIKGTMPVSRADLIIDFAKVSNSSVFVDVDVLGAKAGFPFASQAMKSPKVLNASRFPHINFTSTKVRKNGAGALVEGNITVRGETRPMTLTAEIFRQRGTEENDLTRLTIILTGAVSRSEFGASGWSDFAGDEIRFRILARIQQVN